MAAIFALRHTQTANSIIIFYCVFYSTETKEKTQFGRQICDAGSANKENVIIGWPIYHCETVACMVRQVCNLVYIARMVNDDKVFQLTILILKRA